MEYLKNNLIQKIEEKIKKENIKMKPKWFFVFKSILNISFILILFLASIYIGNFIFLIFYDHKSIIDNLNLNPFEIRKILDFLKIIPFLLIFLMFIFMFSLLKLVEDYSFIYRRRKFFIIIFLFIFIISTIFNIHNFFDREFKIAKFGEKGEMPILDKVHKYYRNQNIPPQFRNFDENSRPFR